ncbi:MAG: cyclic pyranopterin monophosphate synthase MoaC [Opitutales bacterium]|jgi:cyclic pyranopterin phosphate synthase|nr:cyclic pyranopterin monophosphate synthase MoaC [Opitutales bacterium]|tara:strand:- start:672 stop:1151 length:480 start_codon:yes stop_codon:yes gene_type:complete
MEFTHIDEKGRPTMVDVGDKQTTTRVAVARATLDLPPEVAERLVEGDITTAKGSVFSTAILAGIQAAKKTPQLIPLCHVVPLDDVSVEVTPGEDGRELVVICRAKAEHKTGVEMEALTGATVAALTIYDMTKALSRDVVVREIRLMEKSGGKNDFRRED